MKAKLTGNNLRLRRSPFGHAVVIGGSIAGLTAAQVLTGYFDKVTIVERDRLPDTPQFRRGAPQARHAHTLPLRGLELLEQRFPELGEELLAHGAVAINGGSEMAFHIAGSWHVVRHYAAIVSLTCSRPLLETTLYGRVANHPKVQIIQEHDVVGLGVDERGSQVTGVRLHPRQGLRLSEVSLDADLVVDASGRGSQAPQWLAHLGYTPPRETVINAFPGYATRIYRRPASFEEKWKTLYVRPTPPHGTRGGVIIPIEDDLWYVTLIGMGGDYPPTDEEGYLDFARSLPTPELYDLIKDTQPLTKPCGYRQAENRVRHYDQLPRYLEGFLVCGDAAYALNPVYAQGMTAAVMAGVALDNSLKPRRYQWDLTGLAAAFQKQLSQIVADPWQMAISQDQRWPNHETSEARLPVWYRVQKERAPTIQLTMTYQPAYTGI